MRSRSAGVATALAVFALAAGCSATRIAHDRSGSPPSAATKPETLPPPSASEPGDAAAWVDLGDALIQKARETADASQYGRAEEAYRKALSLDARSTAALAGMAWVAGSRHEFEQSVEWAKKAIALDPDNSTSHGLLGDAALELGDYTAAFRSYQRMLDIRPDLSSYSRGAYLLYLTGDVRRATWLMQKAIDAGAPYAENTAWCKEQLALMLWHTGSLMAAEGVLERALESSRRNHHLLAAMGRVKASRRDFSTAIDYYRRAIAIAAEPEVVIALGDVYTAAGQPDQAEKQYALLQAIHAENRANGVRDELLMARFHVNHDQQLGAALEQTEQLYRVRRNVFVADALAWSLYKNARYEEAKRMIHAALEHGTPDASFRFHAGMIYAKLGERQAAKRYLYEALSLNPGFHPLDATVAANTLKELAANARPPPHTPPSR